MIPALIHVSGRPSTFSAQADITSAKARSAVIVKRSDLSTRASRAGRWNPSSGSTPRFCGSTQKTSGASRLSAIGKTPAA
jgi:hypothetical protein